jgi:lactoylglutathione lyase
METTDRIELRLGRVIAYVDDPAAASRFYQQTFGLKPEFEAPDGSYAQLDTGPTRLAFASYALGDDNVPGGVLRAPQDGPPPNVEITLVADDVDGAFARAVEAGCAPLSPPHDAPHGQRVSYLRDPFGMLVEIAAPL